MFGQEPATVADMSISELEAKSLCKSKRKRKRKTKECKLYVMDHMDNKLTRDPADGDATESSNTTNIEKDGKASSSNCKKKVNARCFKKKSRNLNPTYCKLQVNYKTRTKPHVSSCACKQHPEGRRAHNHRTTSSRFWK